MQAVSHRFIKTLIFIASLLAVVSCSGENTITEINTKTTTGLNASLSLTLTNSNDSDKNVVQIGTAAIFTASVVDVSKVGMSNQVITYSLDADTAQSSSIITNSSGEATITINTAALTASVVTLSIEVVVNEESIAVEFPFEVSGETDGITADSISVGYFDADNNFIENEIYTEARADDGISTISAGATLGLQFSIVDTDTLEKITTPIEVEFTSSCVQIEKATISTVVTSVNGVVNATYKDINCATADGNSDTITAALLLDNPPAPLIHNVDIRGEELGSIGFVSASPEQIVIKGTGGQGTQETSILTFIVRGELENPLPQIPVTFSLSTNAGGATLVEESGITDADGLVSVIVRSGTTPTPIRVNASATYGENTIETQSDLLTITTGLPDQDSITISLSTTNPEAYDITGQEVIVSAYLSDSFNNPVPDGTTVNFNAEAGQIGGSCNTTDGLCTVTWRSTNPRVDDHRVTIFAYAVGHETFVDSNGNNSMDDNDGTVSNTSIDCPDSMTADDCVNSVTAGFQIVNATLSTGFFDLAEAWRDDNENYVFDDGDELFDYNNNAVFESGDGYFNGPHCDSETLCPDGVSNLLHVRKATVLITSSSTANIDITNVTDSATVNAGETVSIVRGEAKTFSVYISDTANQTMPFDSSIVITASGGSINGDVERSISNTVGTWSPDGNGGTTMSFTITNVLADSDEAAPGEIVSISVTSPAGIVTTKRFILSLL
jgi:hypothetical protein